MYDVTIIGAGPAGISASLYAKRANLNVLVLYYGESNLEQAVKIDNYYGFKEGVGGEELFNSGIEQAKNLGVQVENLEVLGIEGQENSFIINTEKENFETKTIIIATGNRKLKPNILGIKEFEGKGVSYCAICDAFFYRNKKVAVIGNGKFAVKEATELSHVAGNVTILTNGLEKPECKFDVKTNKIKAIIGDERVSKVEFEDGSSIEIDGIFVALGEAGAGDFARILGIIQKGENIQVNEEMETNVPGIYACGNITGGLLQVCKAVYEGAKAGLTAVNYVRASKE